MNYLLLLLIGAIWGAQFVLIDASLVAFSPEQLALFRTFYAVVFLVLFCLILNVRRSNARSLTDWVKVASIGVLEVVIPFTLVMWAQQFLTGSMASILMGTIPFFTLLLVMLTKVERASVSKFAAMIVGFIGLLVLLAPDLLSSGLSGSVVPKLAILLGSLSFAGALIVIKSMPKENAFILSRDAFAFGTVIMFVINLAQGNLSDLHFPLIPVTTSIVLGVFCSGLVYVLYVYLIKRAGAGFCSLSNYLVPLFGSVLGVLIMNDHITLRMVVACLLILLSIAVEPFLSYLKYIVKSRQGAKSS